MASGHDSSGQPDADRGGPGGSSGPPGPGPTLPPRGTPDPRAEFERRPDTPDPIALSGDVSVPACSVLPQRVPDSSAGIGRLMDSAETERLAKDLLDRTRAETTQAENKAAILLAGVLAGAGGIVAAGGGKLISAHRPWYVTVPLWAAAATTLAAIACLAAAIYPRSRPHIDQRLSEIGYFGDVAALDSPIQLRTMLSESGTQLLDVWIDQIWQTSALVSHKYQCVRWSVRLLAVALALAIVALVVTAV
jgi:hypothetical protein